MLPELPSAMHVSFIPLVHFSNCYRGRTSRCPKMSLQHTRLTFRNAQQEKLVALLTTKAPPSQRLNLDLIVLCHGFHESKDSALMSRLSEKLGLPNVRIDFSGNGESEGEFQFGNYEKEKSDLRALIVYLRSVGGNVTTIVGHSKGGGVVLLYAAEYGDVRNVVNMAGRYDMRGGVRERFGEDKYNRLMSGESVTVSGKRNGERFEYCVTSEDLQARFAVDIDKAVRRISSDVRVVSVHGNDDTVIPVGDGHEINSRIRNGKLVVLDGCGHSFQGFEGRVVSEIVALNDERMF